MPAMKPLRILLVIILLSVALVGVVGGKEKVILDTDMVVLFDDGVAMMMLANHPDVELLGVTIVPGNTWVAEGTAYALRQLELLQRTDIPVAGRGGKATLEVGLFNFMEGRFLSEHDMEIGRKLAHVLAGGDLSGTQKVGEQYLLDLERSHSGLFEGLAADTERAPQRPVRAGKGQVVFTVTR